MQEPAAVTETSKASRIGWTLLAVAVMAVGAAVRLRFYLYNRSMYRDEAALALNIVHRSFAGLLKPLDNDQGAPVGFLLLEKLVVSLLGNHEYALRLMPLVASILTLPLFYWLCRQFLSQPLAVIALIVVAMGEKQYDYSADTKQYAVDVFVTVALMLLAMLALGSPLRQTAGSRRGLFALAVAGAAAVWVSHPAVFVLGAIGVMAAMERLIAKPRSGILDLPAVALLWILSFGANYLLILHRLSHNHFMQSFWIKADAFAPIPKSFQSLVWYKETFFAIFESPCSLGFVGLSALVFVLGVGWLYRRRKSAAVLVLLPVIFALATSLAHRYPFKERLILFICPLIAIFIGAGFAYLFEGQRKAVGIIALLFLLITPLNKTREYIPRPWLHSDMRKVMSLVAANRRPGDQLYVYEFCYYPYEYYRDRFGIADMPAIRGKQDVDGVEGYKREFADLKGKRVWVMFEDAPERQSALAALDDMGKRVFEARPFDEYVACYDLR
ncbi:MAG: glycosyltransferase family 39 protein [Tepidisphaeraceae bacterium]